MDWLLLFAILLYILCSVLMVIELLIRSRGIVTIFAMSCLIGGVAIFFRNSIVTGWIGIFIAIMIIPFLVIFSYKYFSLKKRKSGKERDNLNQRFQ